VQAKLTLKPKLNQVNQVELSFDEVVNLMIEHVLESNPNADKWIEVNQGSSKSDQKSKVWEKASLEGLDERLKPLDKALTITEVVPEGVQDSLSITLKPYPVLPSPGQVLTSPGSPFQVNINVTSDKRVEAPKVLTGTSEVLGGGLQVTC
jgi:hypothetical protein